MEGEKQMIIPENRERLNELEQDIKERKVILEKLYNQHWLYAMQKDLLESKKREYTNLLEQYEQHLTGEIK